MLYAIEIKVSFSMVIACECGVIHPRHISLPNISVLLSLFPPLHSSVPCIKRKLQVLDRKSVV